jgi:hypothetical protein
MSKLNFQITKIFIYRNNFFLIILSKINKISLKKIFIFIINFIFLSLTLFLSFIFLPFFSPLYLF